MGKYIRSCVYLDTLLRMACLKLADIEREYETAMREMEDTPHRVADSTLTDMLLSVIDARKALMEHRQTCIFCKTINELKRL